MTFGSSLLATIVLALAVSATPVVVGENTITLPLVKRVHINGTLNLLQRDQARASHLKARALAKLNGTPLPRPAAGTSVTAMDQSVDYIVNLGIGSPPTYYNLMVDTGSSNTWVGAGKPFIPTSTSKDTGEGVYVSYGSGIFIGEEYTDTVTFGSGLTVTQQSIGVASNSEGFDSVDGILGIGPVNLTVGSLDNIDQTIPTVTDNLYSQGVITNNLVAVSFAPTTSESDANGELTFGGTDSSKYTGPINYIPLTSTFPASEYWGIDESITYGSSKTSILSSTAGIVDTGTTLVLIASDAFSKYKSATGATEDQSTGLLRVSSSQYSQLQSLYFNTGSVTFELTANAQIWPRSLNTDIGGTANDIYLIVADLGNNSGEGLDFINGYTFLQRYYSVFDTANKRVGFASTSHTTSTSN
ncbi:acid protease [Amylocystis lapponica]|nr:acid protease [Amylocystis lapponica]